VTGPRPPFEADLENVWEAPKAPIGATDDGPGIASAALWWVPVGYVAALIVSTIAAVTRPDPIPVGVFIALVVIFYPVAAVALLVALVRVVRRLLSLAVSSRGRATAGLDKDA
jgi:hypothetical protein